MAALSSSGPALCPSFAVVCSFLERYGAALDLPEMSFPQMEKYLRDTSTVPKPLVELHVKLLRKLGKSVSTDRWEKYLAKVCQELNNTWAWELKQRGYKDMPMECKSSILKYLCESLFDDNLKFKTAINEEEPEAMRLQPIGRDRRGLMYWFQVDHEQNIRLYTEEQDDLDGSTWKCIVRSRSDLADALELLKAQVKPGSQDEDNGNTDKQSDSERAVPIKEEPIKHEVQQECSKLEEKHKYDFKPPGGVKGSVPVFDNRVSTITTVKAESREALRNTVSVLIAPGMVKQDVPPATMRSNQQAKIPLKKRELKLSESYHSNHLSNHSSTSIIVCNPSVIQTTDRPELPNGRVPLVLPHKTGQNGVTGVTVGHVGVIRSPLDCSKLQQPNQHAQREDSRQSVLVQKEETRSEKINIQSAVLSLKPHDLSKIVEEDVDLTNATDKAQIVKETINEDTVENSSCHPKDDPEKNVPISSSKEGTITLSPQEQGEDKAAVNGADVKNTPAPVEEASSELQKEGIRLKIKIPPHRRDKVRARSAKEQCKVRGASERPLRRSARICRPSSKAAECQRKKVGQKKQTVPVSVRAEREEEETEDRAGTGTRKLRGKRRPGRPRWTTPRSKRQRLHQDVQEEDTEELHTESKPGIECEKSTRGDACTRCGLPNHPELILLCDLCDCGYHTACLRPPLMLIPDGEWFCPSCQHKQLCEKLEEQLQELDSALRRRERAEKRRERLVYVGISVENIIPEGDGGEEKCVKKKDSKRSKNVWRRSTRARKLISYRFDDFDDAIEEAIDDDKHLSGRHCKALRAVSDEREQWPIKGRDRKRKRRRLNDLESDSTAVDSEDEFLLSHSSGEEVCASGADDDEDEAESEVCSWDSISRGAPRGRPKGRTKGRPRGRPRGRRPQEEYSDQDTDSEAFSVMSDSDDDKTRKGLRRGQRQQVNYCETSDSSDNTEAATQKIQKRQRERLSSDYSDVSALSTESEDYGKEEDTGRRRPAKDLSRNRVRQRHRQREKPQRSQYSHTDSDTSQSSEQERPLRKRLNRIASDEEESDHGGGRRTRAPTGPWRKHKGPSQDSGNSGPNSPQS